MNRVLMAVALSALVPLALAAGDAKRGAQLFRQCLACHSVQPGEHLTGPSLADVTGRRAGSAQGFRRYSDALKQSGAVWDEATLDKWLADPEKLIPGNNMTFPGVRDAKARQDLIAYLKTAAEHKAPAADQKGGRGGMMHMQARKLDLKSAPPEGRVTAIRYCGDTYTVDTADGKSQKIWEFNLRFKSDSGKLGPAPGKPVVVGAGMRGDRASIVFASPGEMSGAFKQSCE
ncbi:MAG: cytochrome c family protein [Burkholderiales bacterium]